MEYHLHKPVKEPLLFGEQQRLIMVQWRNYDMTTMLFCLNNNPILFRYWGKSLLNLNHWVDERETEQEAMAFAIACSRNSWTLMFSGWFRRSFYCFLNAPWTSNETITTMNLSGRMAGSFHCKQMECEAPELKLQIFSERVISWVPKAMDRNTFVTFVNIDLAVMGHDSRFNCAPMTPIPTGRHLQRMCGSRLGPDSVRRARAWR